MAKIYCQFGTTSGLTVTIEVRNKADGVALDFQGLNQASNIGGGLYFFEFTEEAGVSYTWTATATGWTMASGELSPASSVGSGGGLTQDEHDRLFSTATKGDVSFSPAITFEEKQKLWRDLDAIKNKATPVTDIGPIAKEMAKTNQIIEKLAKPSDLKVTVNVAPDPRIESIVTAISGLSEYLKPDDRLSGILTALQIISQKELDKEAIQAIEGKIKNIDKEDMKSIEDSVKEILGEAITHLFDRMFPDNTPLQNKLYDLWVSKQ